MALTKVTGQVIKNTTDVTVGVLTVTNTLAVGGTVSIGGTLTYEDVTNIDSVGLITARNGIVVGSGITLSKDGDIFATGISTVKGIHINGTLEGEDLKVGTGVTITRDGDIFATGISTFSEKVLIGTTTEGVGGADELTVANSSSSAGITVRSSTTATGNIYFSDGTSGADEYRGVVRYDHSDNYMSFWTNATERVRITSTGRIHQSGNDEDIDMDSSANGQLKLDGNNYSAAFALNATGLNIYHNSSTRGIIFGTDETERARIAADGKVGINTAIPTAQLEIVNSKIKTWTPTTQTELLVERDGNCMVSIIGDNDANCILNFGDSDDENVGNIDYDHANDTMIFRCGAVQRAKIESDGRLVLGSPTLNTNVDYSLIAAGRIQSDGTYDTTTGSSANVNVGSNGLLRRSTSSARYKKDIIDATWGLADVLKLKPKLLKVMQQVRMLMIKPMVVL